MEYETAREMVRKMLSAKRYQHSLNVKKLSVKLAKKHGADPEKAALAAILHDAAKELPKERQLQILHDNATISDGALSRPSPVWHGICAAILAREEWGVEDEEILSAIRCHTTGKPNMGLLDKILFLADMTSAERNFDGVEELRRLEMKDLDRAMLDALEMTIAFVEKSGKPVDPMSRAALKSVSQQYIGGKVNHE